MIQFQIIIFYPVSNKLKTAPSELEEEEEESSEGDENVKLLVKSQESGIKIKEEENTENDMLSEKSQESGTGDKEDSAETIKSLKSQLKHKKKSIKKYKKKLKEQETQLEKIKEENSQLKMQLSIKESNNGFCEIKVFTEKEINDFEILEEISYNNNGKVVKVAKKQIFVLKIMNAKKSNVESLKLFLNEYEIMNMLNHPNIIKTFGICLDSVNMPPSIVIEFCIGNLEEAILNKKFTKVEIAFAIYQIAEGMKYVHYKKIIHRDLKPTNILIASDGTIRIADFGISKLMSPNEQNTLGIGTQKFMAPEILNEEEYDEKVDVYSFGVVALFALNNGEMPVTKMRDVMIGKKHEIPSSFTSFAKRLIDSCWNFDPKDRPSFNRICEQLNEYCHTLFELSDNEISQLKESIEKHKLRIPVYDYSPQK